MQSDLQPVGRRQQRRGFSDRTSERSRDLVGATVILEAKTDEKLVFATALYFFEAPRMVYSVLGTVRPRAAAAPVALSLGNGGSDL